LLPARKGFHFWITCEISVEKYFVQVHDVSGIR
jgi:hypothetical protein